MPYGLPKVSDSIEEKPYGTRAESNALLQHCTHDMTLFWIIMTIRFLPIVTYRYLLPIFLIFPPVSATVGNVFLWIVSAIEFLPTFPKIWVWVYRLAVPWIHRGVVFIRYVGMGDNFPVHADFFLANTKIWQWDCYVVDVSASFLLDRVFRQKSEIRHSFYNRDIWLITVTTERVIQRFIYNSIAYRKQKMNVTIR